MVASCCVVGCCNTFRRSNSVKFYRFPAVRSRYCSEYQNILATQRKAWINAIKRKNVSDENVDNLRICNEHFISGKSAHFRDTLDPDWIPSVRMGCKQSDNLLPQKKLNRYVRAFRRNQIRSNPIPHVQSSTESVEEAQNNTKVMITFESDVATSNEDIVDLPSALEETVNNFEADTQNVEEAQNNSEVTITSMSDTSAFNEGIFDLLNAPEDTVVSHIEPDVEIVIASPDDVSVLEYNLNDQGPPVASLQCPVTDEIPLMEGEQSLQRELALLRVQMLLQRNEMETKDKEILYLKEQTAKLHSELTDRCSEVYDSRSEVKRCRSEVKRCQFDEDAFVNDDKKLNYFTGIPNLKLFNLLLEYVGIPLNNLPVQKLTSFQKLVLALMKLRTNISFVGLGYRFNISTREASLLFQQIIIILENTFSYLVHWPDRENLRAKVPISFRKKFGNAVSVVIDCFEIGIERPGNTRAKAQTFSNYKHKHTVKYLLGITPHGFISFISDGWGGRVSDKKITEECGILDNLLPGDIVLADRGFTINELVALQYAKLNTPEFTRGKKQLHPRAIENGRKISSVRIHIERVIALIRGKFQILKGPIPVTVLKAKYNDRDLLDSIVKVCCILTNLCESIIPEN